MITLPSTYLINRYSEVSKRCKDTGEPIYLTSNGKKDLVVLFIEAYEKLLLKERLLDIELEQNSSAKLYSVEELDAAIKELLSSN